MMNLSIGVSGEAAPARAAALLDQNQSLSSQELAPQSAESFNQTLSSLILSEVQSMASQITAARQNSGASGGGDHGGLAAEAPSFPVVVPYQPNGVSAHSNSMNSISHSMEPEVVAGPMPTQQPYTGDPEDNAYWASQPSAVQQLRYITDPGQRAATGAQLAAEGYTVDVPIMIWGWDPAKTMALRKEFGYTWVPSALQQPISEAPGINIPGLTPYDPSNPPPGSIQVT